MKYFDKSVNGLRAIAVIVVIAFHYGLDLFSGGFIGVDIFFVISGYVITLSVLKKMRLKDFSVLGYFNSRFFRIFPALLVVSFLTILASAFILFPADAERSAFHALSSITFSSNFVFWKEVGYFDVSNEFKPFLHTWSLSVEWQFYLLWPIAVYVLCLLKRWAVPLVCFAVLCGAAASGLLSDYSNFVFYMMPLRGWEFALGGLIAFIPQDVPLRQKFSMLSLLGLLGVILSSILYNESTVFPGFAALLPCLSAFMLLFFNRKYTEPVLSLPVLQYLGNISYSLYLYHWPVFILYKHFVFRELMIFDFAVILVSVFVLSHFSYIYIEQWFRKRSPQYRKLKIRILLGIASLCIAVSSYVIITDGKVGRYNEKETALINFFQKENKAYQEKYGVFFPQSAQEEWVAEKHLGLPCLYDDYLPQAPGDMTVINCVIQNNEHQADKGGHYLVVGDSNGKNIYEALVLAFPDRAFSLLMHSGCAPAEVQQCFPYLEGQLQTVFSNTKIDGVILSSRFSYQKIKGLEKTLALLKDSAVPFLVTGATPMLRKPLDMVMLHKNVSLDDRVFTLPLNATFFQPGIHQKDETLEALAKKYGGIFWNKKSILCPEDECSMMHENYDKPLYLDTQHLSHDGIDVLVRAMRAHVGFREFYRLR